ncbi:MAG: glycolate oxidase subunit GlcE [Pseudomonadota bacterium]
MSDVGADADTGSGTLAPTSEHDLVEVIKAAIANREAMAVAGSGSKRAFGHTVGAPRKLTTAAMTGVSLYEAAELVMTAAAGTPMREVMGLLRQQGQQLAFDPVDPAALYGGEPGDGTIGGVFATNLSGSRRLTAGAARDHLLGFRAVSGRGDVFKSGGRVMKNVTGYDLSKLITGSHGTLAVMSEVTFKVLPKPETERTLAISSLDAAAALAALRTASGSPFEVSCLAYLPERSAKDVGLSQPSALLRLEGPEVSVLSRRDSLAALVGGDGTCDTLDAPASESLWVQIRDGAPVAAREHAVWRISTAPTAALDVVSQAEANGAGIAAHYFDWAGGLIWLAVPASEPRADAIRSAVAASGGHATLMRAPEDVRASVPVFEPQPKPLAALNRRVKEAFDPFHILNPGRMVPGDVSETPS